MLAVSPLRSIKDEKNQGEMEGNFSMATTTTTDDVVFGDLSEGNLLESINFDDLFVGIDINGDVLPDLEMFHEFSVDVNTGEESSEMNSSADNSKVENDQNVMINTGPKKEEEEDKASCNSSGQDLGSIRGEEIVSKRDESVVVNPAPKDGGKGRKSSSAQSKNNNSSNNAQGKRKVKVAR